MRSGYPVSLSPDSDRVKIFRNKKIMMSIPQYKPAHTWIGRNRHYITPYGNLPGVTTILSKTKPENDKASLQRWKDRIGHDEADRISKESLERGTWLHTQIENYLTHNTELTDEHQWKGFWQSIRPFLGTIEETILIEKSVFHGPLKYAGTVDCLARIGNETVVCDWKTASKPKNDRYIGDYYLQSSAYASAINWLYNEYGIKVDRVFIVIALGNSEAQLFDLDHNEIEAWSLGFRKRLEEYSTL